MPEEDETCLESIGTLPAGTPNVVRRISRAGVVIRLQEVMIADAVRMDDRRQFVPQHPIPC